ncbi:ribosome small subunit-dependent GTPase A [Tannerella sp. oral taxon 808]|nr:ribosome small subunit-dependent GTPase A [Tannerella sp. oral taxon 808]
MHGLVIKNTGSRYTVCMDGGRCLDCKIKGSFRIKGIRTTNPVAIGDRVTVEVPTNEADTAYITAIAPRRNYMIRRASNLSKESHILAANIDLALLVVTIDFPVTTLTFIDRFLATAEAYAIPALLAFNKIDRYDADARRTLDAHIALYTAIGYDCLPLSALTGQGVEALTERLQGKITLLSGHSGTGKSTLINSLLPDADLRTQAISEYHRTGVHTTTFSEMLPLPDGSGYLIDTPGIKGFGTIEMQGPEVAHYFPEIFRTSANCRFNNCTHTTEPGCAVRREVASGAIAPSRYRSYLNILEDEDGNKYREAY